MNTLTKRSSAIGVGLPFRSQVPIPDGAVGQGDRQQFEYAYAGILWEAPVVAASGTVRATAAGGSRVAASVTSSERVAATPRIVEGC